MKISLDIKGANEIEKALLRIEEGTRDAAAAALYEEGLGVDADMVPRIPVDTGILRASHYVAPPTESGNSIVVEVGVGTDYAAPVHERTEVRHAVGEAKFLERALAARVGGMMGRLASSIGRHMQNGTVMVPLKSDPPARPKAAGRRARKAPGRGKSRKGKS